MTPKEKSKELYYKYINALYITDLQITANQFAKQCALIAIDEILKANAVWHINSIPHKYWTNVKNEIQKL